MERPLTRGSPSRFIGVFVALSLAACVMPPARQGFIDASQERDLATDIAPSFDMESPNDAGVPTDVEKAQDTEVLTDAAQVFDAAR